MGVPPFTNLSLGIMSPVSSKKRTKRRKTGRILPKMRRNHRKQVRREVLTKQGTLISKRQRDSILTLQEVALALRLDLRTVRKVGCELGGKRFGNRWRFKWGTVLEYFDNAYFETEQRQSLDGTGDTGWQAGRLQNVPRREEIRPGMAGRQGMGGRTARKSNDGEGRGATSPTDPFGLRKALGLG